MKIVKVYMSVGIALLGTVLLLVVISVILLIAFGSHVGTASGKTDYRLASCYYGQLTLQRLLYVM